MNRRTLIKAVPFIGAGVAIQSADAGDRVAKHPAEEIRELSGRISDLIGQLPPGFCDHIEIEKDSVAHFYAADIRRMREPITWPADVNQRWGD